MSQKNSNQIDSHLHKMASVKNLGPFCFRNNIDKEQSDGMRELAVNKMVSTEVK